MTAQSDFQAAVDRVGTARGAEEDQDWALTAGGRLLMEEVLERTERMMAGLKRGIEEMRGGGMVEMRGGNGEAVPLPGPRGEKRDREKTPVWAVSGAPSSQSDK